MLSEAPALLDPALIALAAGQHGMFTTAQANRLGLDASALCHLVKARRLWHPGRGLYGLVSMRAEGEVERHTQLAVGGLLVYPDAVLTSVSAVLAHDLPTWGVDLTRPALARPIERGGGMRALWLRPMPDGAKVVHTLLGPSLSAEAAVVHLAMDWGVVAGVVSADAALHRGLVTASELAHQVDTVAGSPRCSRASAMLRFIDGRRESVGESRCAVALAALGFDVEPQVVVSDRHGTVIARVDFLLRDTKLIVEFDGKVKYTGPDALWREKKREDLLRRMGYLVVRVTWSDLDRPGKIAARIRRTLALAS